MGQLAAALMSPLQRRITEAGTVGQRDVAAMLKLLGESALRSSLDEGSAAVANLAGVAVEAVWERMPIDTLVATAVGVGDAQINALEAMSSNENEWLSAFESVAGFGIDLLLQNKVGLGGLGIGDALSAFAGKKFREGRVQEALATFGARLQEFEALVGETAMQLDADAELVAAMTKKNEGSVGCGIALLLGCAVLLVGLAYLGWRGWKWAFGSDAPALVVSAPPPPSTRSPLVGDWTTSTAQVLRAVELGDAVEFDILQLGSWADQGYATREMRFRLRRVGDAQDVFTVEDKTRPIVLKGVTFAPAAAETCHVIRSEVDDVPLRARLNGDRLVVESVRSSLPAGALRWQGRAVVGCAMDRASESKVEVVLNRVGAAAGDAASPSAPRAGSNSPSR